MAILIPGQTTSDFYNILSSDGGASNISITQAGSNQLLGHKTLTIPTAGTYVPDDIEVRVEARVNVGAGSLSNQVAAADENNYTDNSANAPVLISGSYLYIHEGWFPNQKISLAKLVPDFADHEATAAHILEGYQAWTEDGTLLVGALHTVNPTFSGGDVTATVGLTTTDPELTIGSAGKFADTTVSGDYGVRTTPYTGTDGTDFLKIELTTSSTNGSANATAGATRDAVLWDDQTSGNIAKVQGETTNIGAANATPATDNATITTDITNNFQTLYIPIVNPTFTGGTLSTGTVSHTHAAGQSAAGDYNITVTPDVSITSNATGFNASTYGIVTTQPASGNYVKFDPGATAGNAESVTVSIPVTRSAVTYNGTFQGAINKTTTDTVLTAASPETFTGSASVGTTVGNGTDYYVPITTVSINQPTLNGGTLTVSPANSRFTVTPSTSITDSASTAITEENYGISGTAPSGSSYLILNPEAAASGSIGVDASGTVTLNAGSVTYGSGLVKGGTGTINGGSQSCNGTTTMSASTYVDVAAGSNKYVKIVTPTAAVSFDGGNHTASVNATTAAEYDTATATSFGNPTLYTSAAAAGSTYVKITSAAENAGTVLVTATPSVTTAAGVTTAQTVAGSSVDCTATVNVTATDKYMKVYTGGGATWA